MQEISLATPAVDFMASNPGMAGVEMGQRPESAEAAAAMAVQFESLFMSMLMKEMRNTLGEGALFGGESSDVYGGMFDMMMGDALAESQPLGIARTLQSALQSYENNEAKMESGSSAETPEATVDLNL